MFRRPSIAAVSARPRSPEVRHSCAGLHSPERLRRDGVAGSAVAPVPEDQAAWTRLESGLGQHRIMVCVGRQKYARHVSKFGKRKPSSKCVDFAFVRVHDLSTPSAHSGCRLASAPSEQQ